MARDFGYVCETEFPARALAEYLARQYAEHDARRRRDLLQATKQVGRISDWFIVTGKIQPEPV